MAELTVALPSSVNAKYTKPVGGIPVADLKKSDLDGLYAGAGIENFVAKADMNAPAIGIALAGDSTGDAGAEWFRRGLEMWLVGRTEPKVDYFYFYGDTGPYSQDVIQAGTTVPTETVIYRDTFTRTVSDIYGTTPDIGVAYTGAAGAFSADGASAVSLGAATGIIQNTSQVGGRRKLTANITIDTTPGATDKRLDIYMGASAANRISVRITAATNGTISWQMNKTYNSAFSTLTNGTGTPLTPSAVNTVDLVIEFNGTTVTATLNGVTITGTLSSAEQTAIVDAAARVDLLTTNAASAGIKINNIELVQIASGVGQTIKAYNGSRSGSILQHQQDRITALYPADQQIDLLCISSSHNYAMTVGNDYLAAIDSFIAAYRAVHPESGIMICSQNPEYPSAAPATIARHLGRLALLRGYARRRGYAYLPVAELFAAQSDGGASWVLADGVHPKTAADAADPNNGSYQWAKLFSDTLKAASFRPAV